MSWSLFESKESGNEMLSPLKFSNGKTQEDVVKEIISAIDEGNRVIFIRGVCGTGKSAIALNLAREVERMSIVVPVKNLQKQYETDYTEKKYLLKKNGEKMKIKVLTGRTNHKCPFLNEWNFKEEKKSLGGLLRRPENLRLDIFDDPESARRIFERKKREEGRRKDEESLYVDTCNNPILPCKIEIKEKNGKIIREYIKNNENIKQNNFVDLSKVRRMSIAPVCPYWSPMVPSDMDLKILGDAKKRSYEGLLGKKYTLHQRKPGCGYYEQFKSYLDADVLIFNSQKYKLEVAMNRKPLTDVEIIDECDEFLDSFSNHKNISINKLNFALGSVFADKERIQEAINDLTSLTSSLLKDRETEKLAFKEDVIPLKETKIYDLIKTFLDLEFMSYVECDEENYCYYFEEVARTFEDFLDDSFVSFSKEGRELIARIVTTSLERRFSELLDKSKVLVLMSGTLHSEQVLKDIFGIKDFKIIDAETQMSGIVEKVRTGKEVNCKYQNFQQGRVTKKEYLEALSLCISLAKRPTLVHVNSFQDLPTEQEKIIYRLGDIMSQEKLREKQNEEGVGESVENFKKNGGILYSTKCNRGVDFPGEICNSVILTKYPYPNVSSIFWKILRQTKPEYYNEFYMDKSRREFLQRIYRALRSKEDKVQLLSPDIRVFWQSL